MKAHLNGLSEYDSTDVPPARRFRFIGPLHMTEENFVGKRADKVRVDAVRGEVTDEELEDMYVSTSGVFKEIEYYTVTCPECDGDGRYDERGDIICEDCGVVISGDAVVLPVEHTGSRGFSDKHNNSNIPGHTGPNG